MPLFAKLLKILRWFLALLILFAALGLAWLAWVTGRGFVWIVFGCVLLVLFLVVVWGGKITSWLARRLERRILHSHGQAPIRVVAAGLQQGKNLVQLSHARLDKNIQSVDRVLAGARQNLENGLPGNRGTLTWVSMPSPHNEAGFCPACGRELRSAARFCDRCGKPIMRF